MRLVLALDAGTSSVRALAFGPDLQPVDLAQQELTQHFPAPGEVEHDPTEIVALAVHVLSELGARARERNDEVVAIGITNQRETTVALDRAVSPIGRAIVWQDRRTAQLCAALEAAGHRSLVRASTGLVLDPYFSATKMRWLLDHDSLVGAATPALGTIDALVIWALSGGANGGAWVTEPSNASRTSLFDLHRRTWSEPLSTVFGVPLELLPELRPSAGLFAHVHPDVLPGLAGVPISGVLGDQQAALFGQACFRPGMVKATYGTGSFLLAHAGDEPPNAPEGLLGTVAWDLGSHGVAYALEGASFVAGAAIQWLRDELGFIASSEEFGPLALSTPDAGGVAFVPAFTGLGSPFWRPDARGAIIGLSRGTTRAQVARALFEALAFQTRAVTDVLRNGDVPVSELRVDGGVTNLTALLDLQATLSRAPVRRSTSREATARGAAAAAGLAVGVWPDLAALAELWTADYEAQPKDATAADLAYGAWLRAAERA